MNRFISPAILASLLRREENDVRPPSESRVELTRHHPYHPWHPEAGAPPHFISS